MLSTEIVLIMKMSVLWKKRGSRSKRHPCHVHVGISFVKQGFSDPSS